jgi:hypothetical protein
MVITPVIRRYLLCYYPLCAETYKVVIYILIEIYVLTVAHLIALRCYNLFSEKLEPFEC